VDGAGGGRGGVDGPLVTGHQVGARDGDGDPEVAEQHRDGGGDGVGPARVDAVGAGFGGGRDGDLGAAGGRGAGGDGTAAGDLHHVGGVTAAAVGAALGQGGHGVGLGDGDHEGVADHQVVTGGAVRQGHPGAAGADGEGGAGDHVGDDLGGLGAALGGDLQLERGPGAGVARAVGAGRDDADRVGLGHLAGGRTVVGRGVVQAGHAGDRFTGVGAGGSGTRAARVRGGVGAGHGRADDGGDGVGQEGGHHAEDLGGAAARADHVTDAQVGGDGGAAGEAGVGSPVDQGVADLVGAAGHRLGARVRDVGEAQGGVLEPHLGEGLVHHLAGLAAGPGDHALGADVRAQGHGGLVGLVAPDGVVGSDQQFPEGLHAGVRDALEGLGDLPLGNDLVHDGHPYGLVVVAILRVLTGGARGTKVHASS